MDIIQVKKYLIDSLSQLPYYKSEKNGTQHVVKCPMSHCNDSMKGDHGHFSIRIDPDDDSIMKYRCFKCDTRGILTSEVLSDLGIELPADYEQELLRYLKRSARRGVYTSQKALSYKVPQLLTSGDLTTSKLSYLENRLGIPFDSKMASDYKIILNFGEFLAFNEITHLKISSKFISLLHYRYIGFLSSNNNMIVFRNLYNDDNKRYINVTLHDNFANNNTFYSVPNRFDPLYITPMTINIAEGIFDILSILLNVNKGETDHQFYFAACGIGYQRILKHAIHMGLNTDLTLNLFADNDRDESYINKEIWLMKKRGLYPWFAHINIHRNQFQGEKDYGVPVNRIQDGYRVIK